MIRPDVEHILDHLRIEQALIAYCVHLDRMELTSVADLFSEDCIVDFGNNPHLKSNGRKHLAKSLERMWRWTRTSHHLSNVLIEFADRDTARCTSYVHAWHERADGSTATVLGQYKDVLLRVSGHWLIHRRRMVMNGCDAGFTVPVPSLNRLPPPVGWIAPEVDGSAPGKPEQP